MIFKFGMKNETKMPRDQKQDERGKGGNKSLKKYYTKFSSCSYDY